MDFSNVMKALNEASSFELYRLRSAITHALDEPERLQAIISQLKVGQQIEYFDGKQNTSHQCTILELRRKVALVVVHGDGSRWLVDYSAINLNGADVRIRQPAGQSLSRNEIADGEILGYISKSGRECSGKVIRRNEHTVTMNVGDAIWRVPYRFLHRVVEADIIEVVARTELGMDTTPPEQD